MMWWRKNKRQIEFDEILLDASNLPSFDTRRVEGRREVPISVWSIGAVGAAFLLIAGTFTWQLFKLQVVEGAAYRERSENNKLADEVIIAERGVIYDRMGELLAWNEIDRSGEYSFPVRAYTDREGLGQLTGYVSYPKKDSKGFYFRTEYLGRSGIEEAYHTQLAGRNGTQLVEVNAHGDVISGNVVEDAVPGVEITLSVDAELSEAMYDIIATSTAQSGSRSGAAAIMDVHTGEILAITSFPSFDPEVMADGDDLELIQSYNEDSRFPFLNKVIGGAYTPGSIVKPFLAYAALNEGIISPEKIIVSTGQIVIPNPYTPSQPSIFSDWRAHGKMNIREAIAYSSNVYMYYISGGFGEQRGLGITKMDEYYDMFGFGKLTGINFDNEQTGTVPNPEWKLENFDDDWRLGDTYHTSIGQYGWQTTPLQMLVAYGALANGGKLFTPHVNKGEVGEYTEIDLDPWALDIVREGMYMTTYYPGGTARSLEKSYINIAAKSGTAELDFAKARLNTWAAGYWPYENPKYSFIVLMENAPYSNSLGGTRLAGDIVDWIHENRPEYLGVDLETDEE